MLPGLPSLLLERAKKGAETVSSVHLADIVMITTVTKYNSSIQSQNVCFNPETSSLHWKAKRRNTWGQ